MVNSIDHGSFAMDPSGTEIANRDIAGFNNQIGRTMNTTNEVRVVSACLVAGCIFFAASDGQAVPAAVPKERSTRPAAGLESAVPAVRRDAILKLVAGRDPSAVAQLSLALEGDGDEAVRREAASGLGDLADKRGIGALRRCLQLEQSQVVKQSCRVSLARLDPEAMRMAPAGPAGVAPTGVASAAGVAGSSSESSAAPPRAQAVWPQLGLRIDVSARDAAERPNHGYIELVSALDRNALALGFERVLSPRWSLALEPQLSAESHSFGGLKVSAVGVALAVRPHYYFLQQAPSGPYIAPYAAVAYSRATFEGPAGSQEADEVVSGTGFAVGAGVGWSLVVNARAVFKLSAIVSFAKAASTFGASGMEQSSWSLDFSPSFSAGVMF